MPTLSANLIIDRCPHCSVNNPNLYETHHLESNNHSATNLRRWRIYICKACGGLVIGYARNWEQEVEEIFPKVEEISSNIPSPAKEYLQQAINSIHAPAGAVLLAASAVDAMLKLKNYKEGSLYKRIDLACEEHLITDDMAKWAHEVRLDANAQRHADEAFVLPDQAGAKRAVDFALAFAEFLFVLPARVERGLDQASSK
jgi:hypothetical protein